MSDAPAAVKPVRIERFDLDAAGKPCCEGYYAMDGARLLLMPPTAEMAAGLRLATQAEVERGGAVAAQLEHCANAGAADAPAGP